MLLYNDQKEWFVVLMLTIVGACCAADQDSIHGGTCCIGETHVEFDIGLMKEVGEEVGCLWC